MLIFSHGDKGGTGKSMISAVIVDYLLSNNLPVVLLEGDAGQPDIALRYSEIVKIGAVNLNRAGDSDAAVLKFGSWLESGTTPEDYVVVNMPAGGGDTLDELGDVLVDVARKLGHEVRVTYSLGMHKTSSDGLLRSLSSGLLSVIPAKNRSVLFPEFLGKPESFHWYKQPERGKFLKAGGREAAIPALKPDPLRDKVLALPGSFSSLAGMQNGELSLTEKSMLGRWIGKAHAAVAPIVDREQ